MQGVQSSLYCIKHSSGLLASPCTIRCFKILMKQKTLVLSEGLYLSKIQPEVINYVSVLSITITSLE